MGKMFFPPESVRVERARKDVTNEHAAKPPPEIIVYVRQFGVLTLGSSAFNPSQLAPVAR